MIAHDLDTFLRIDALLAPKIEPQELVDALVDPNWQIVQAALQAIGKRRIFEATAAVLEVLEFQDQIDIYGAPDQWSFDGTDDPEIADMWKCRFRVKQAAILALAEIGEPRGSSAMGHEVLEFLARYAVSEHDDYVIRAAACQALGRMKAIEALDFLEQASQDGEWCTAVEARKAMKAIARHAAELGLLDDDDDDDSAPASPADTEAHDPPPPVD